MLILQEWSRLIQRAEAATEIGDGQYRVIHSIEETYLFDKRMQKWKDTIDNFNSDLYSNTTFERQKRMKSFEIHGNRKKKSILQLKQRNVELRNIVIPDSSI